MKKLNSWELTAHLVFSIQIGHWDKITNRIEANKGGGVRDTHRDIEQRGDFVRVGEIRGENDVLFRQSTQKNNKKGKKRMV